MSESYYVGAYWGARSEPPEQCAGRLADFLTRLSDIDPLLATWYPTGDSAAVLEDRRVAPTADDLVPVLLAGQARRDDAGRSVMTEVGYLVGLWNGQPSEVGLTVTCGAAPTNSTFGNSAVIKLPAPDDDAASLYSRKAALSLLQALVESWQPDWATVTSHRLRRAQGAKPGQLTAGWATYTSDAARGAAVHLPPSATMVRLGGGVAIVLADGPGPSVADSDVATIRSGLLGGDGIAVES